jgi:hypothetical protein
MKEPQWQVGGGQVVFAYLGRLFGLTDFIETGTGFGDTLVYMAHSFERCYSIEMDIWKQQLSRELFQFMPNITLLSGDSSRVLPELLEKLPDRPTLFYLDAHGIPGSDNGPLAKEIAAIMKYRPESLIAVDDVGQGSHHDVGLPDLGIDLTGWKIDYRFNRIAFMHKGQYNIPDLGWEGSQPKEAIKVEYYGDHI